jgi:hypothetical protein
MYIWDMGIQEWFLVLKRRERDLSISIVINLLAYRFSDLSFPGWIEIK